MADQKYRLIIEALNRSDAAFDALRRDLGVTAAEVKRTNQRLDEMREAAGAALTAFGVAATGIAVALVHAASDAERTWARVGQQISLADLPVESNLVKIREFSAAMMRMTGHSDEAIASFVGQLLPVTQSLPEAFDATRVAMDMAAATGKSLDASVRLMQMALIGNLDQLRRYIPAIREMSTEQLNSMTASDRAAFALAALREQFGGLAAVEGASAVGQMRLLRETFSDLQETLGAQLLPATTRISESLSGAINAVDQWARRNPELTRTIVTLTAVIGPLSLAIGGLLLALPAIAKAAALVVAGLVILKGSLVVLKGAAAALGAFWIGWRLGELAGEIGIVNRVGNELAGWIAKIPGLAPNVDKANQAMADSTQRLADRLKDIATERNIEIDVTRRAGETLDAWHTRVIAASESITGLSGRVRLSGDAMTEAAVNTDELTESLQRLAEAEGQRAERAARGAMQWADRDSGRQRVRIESDIQNEISLQRDDAAREEAQRLEQRRRDQAGMMALLEREAETLGGVHEAQLRAQLSAADMVIAMETAPKTTERIAEAMRWHIDIMGDEWEQMGRTVAGAMRGVEEVIAGFVARGRFEWRSLVDGIVADMARLGVRHMITQAASWMGLMGTPAGSTPAETGYAAVMHGGGVIGIDRPRRTVALSAATISAAPRLHAGLRSDEYPAVLQRGESVLTPSQMRQLAPAQAQGQTVENHYYIQAVDARSFSDLVQRNPGAIASVIGSSMRTGGPLRDAIRNHL